MNRTIKQIYTDILLMRKKVIDIESLYPDNFSEGYESGRHACDFYLEYYIKNE